MSPKNPLAAEKRLALILREGFKRSNDVMFYCDKKGVILDVNDAFTRHYGWTRKEAVGQNPRIIRSRHSTPELYKRMWSSILDPRKGSWRGEMINRAKDGREIPVLLTITAVRDEAGEVLGFISNAADLSEHFALQSRVADSEALATLGEMAAVVAHEIRNPLGSIVMAAGQLADEALPREERDLVLRILRTESKRLSETLTNFLAFARPRELKLERGDLNVITEEVCRAVQSNPDLIKGIRVDLRLRKSLKTFPMDADQIRQVIWNIVLNAVQAMGGEGELSVETGRDKDLAYLRIRDTGPGIPEKSLRDIFKPFTTTKQQGTGLGLSVAARIVKAHGGRIVAESQGRGATFTVYLPWIED